MSQVFSADSVTITTSTTLITIAETGLVTGNFLNPPFGNAKAIIQGTFALSVGTGTTSLTLRFHRNPNGDNTTVMQISLVNVTAGNFVFYSFQAADAIPDGRPVQYQLSVSQNAATGNGTVSYANVTTMLISG